MAERSTDIKWYIDLYNKTRVAQESLHMRMQDDLKFLYDDQWAGITADKRASRPVINLLLSNIEQEVAMLALQNPSFSIGPAAKDDTKTAELLDTVMRIQMQRIGLPEKQEDLIRFMLTCGTGVVKTYWDNTNPYFPDGDVNIAIIHPLNFFIDPNAPDIESAEYCFYRVFRSADYIRGRYGYDIPKTVSAETRNDVIGHTDMLGEGYWVVECFMRPSWDNGVRTQDGTYAVFLENDTTRWLRPPQASPVPYGDLPFITIKNTSGVQQSIWGMSEVAQTRQIQVELNKQWGFIMDSIRLGNMVKYFTDDPGMKNTTISMNPNELVHAHVVGAHFTMMQPRGVDPGMLQIVSMMEANIRNVTGIHDVSSGAAGNVQAAAAIQSLASLGSQRMSVRQRHMSYGMRKMALQLIALMGQQYKKERYFRLGSAEVNFKGGKVKPYYDIQANYEEDLPSDRMTLFNMAVQIAQLPPDIQGTLTKLLNSPRLTAMVDERRKELAALQAAAAQQPPAAESGTSTGGPVIQGTPEQPGSEPATGAGQPPQQPGAQALPPVPVPPAEQNGG